MMTSFPLQHMVLQSRTRQIMNPLLTIPFLLIDGISTSSNDEPSPYLQDLLSIHTKTDRCPISYSSNNEHSPDILINLIRNHCPISPRSIDEPFPKRNTNYRKKWKSFDALSVTYICCTCQRKQSLPLCNSI